MDPRRETEPLCRGPIRDLDFGSHYEKPNYKKLPDLYDLTKFIITIPIKYVGPTMVPVNQQTN